LVPQPKKFGNKTWKKVSKKNKEKDFNKINFWQKFIRKIFFILINAVTTIFFQKTIFYMNEVKQNIHALRFSFFVKKLR